MAAKTHSIFDPAIIVPAIGESFKKLNPRHMIGNPVMFVTEVGAVITTVLLFTGGQGASFGFLLQITLWLWFTVLFANFAEAMAEGRGKAQADTLRKARTETMANRYQSDGALVQVPSSKLHKDDVVIVKAGSSSPVTARSSKAPRPWTNPPSPENPRRSSAKAAATAAPSPAARASCPT